MAGLCYGACVIGAAAYVYALVHLGTGEAEIASDVGNGVLLMAAVLALAGIHARLVRSPSDRPDRRAGTSSRPGP